MKQCRNGRTVKNLPNNLIIWIISTAWYERTCLVSQLVLCTAAQLYPSLSGWSSWCYTWICSSLAFGTTSAKCEPKQLTHFRTSNSNKSATCTRPWLGKRASYLHCNLNFALSHWDDVQILFQDVKMKRTKRQDFHIGYGNVSIFLRLNDWSLLWASVSTPQVHQTHHKDGCWTCRLQTAQTAHSNSENLWRLQGQRKTSLLTMEYTVQIPPSSSPSAVGTWLQVIQTNLCLMCFGFFSRKAAVVSAKPPNEELKSYWIYLWPEYFRVELWC